MLCIAPRHPQSTRIRTSWRGSANQTTTEFVDTNLQARRTYFYRLFLVDTANVYSPSNSTSAATLGVPIPFADDFETDSGVWTFSGDWGPVAHSGDRRIHEPRRLARGFHIKRRHLGGHRSRSLRHRLARCDFRRTIRFRRSLGSAGDLLERRRQLDYSLRRQRQPDRVGSIDDSTSLPGVVRRRCGSASSSMPTAAFLPTGGISTTCSSVKAHWPGRPDTRSSMVSRTARAIGSTVPGR